VGAPATAEFYTFLKFRRTDGRILSRNDEIVLSSSHPSDNLSILGVPSKGAFRLLRRVGDTAGVGIFQRSKLPWEVGCSTYNFNLTGLNKVDYSLTGAVGKPVMKVNWEKRRRIVAGDRGSGRRAS